MSAGKPGSGSSGSGATANFVGLKPLDLQSLFSSSLDSERGPTAEKPERQLVPKKVGALRSLSSF